MIQRVELNGVPDQLHCPFCGTGVFGEAEATPCAHTLFIATDEGFEYVSEAISSGKAEDADVGTNDEEGDSIDSFVDSLAIENAVIFAMYTPAPSGMGAYVGFAPLASDKPR